ncbi:MAG: UDP-N-acetylmuramoyl-L-alanyl-D-glutamate--2,6-diaminopimelate ligase [Acidobacteria bacterium]|nr:UDP-N-acetylmuramoyl-L-alanyl-D-glutamate--2,6-diaminopimelate ligase [Acidobacteriota bacterium]
MTLRQLLPRLSGVRSAPEGLLATAELGARTVTAVDYDSRLVRPGAVFVALRGERFDGSEFAADAEAQGALLVVASSPAPVGVQAPWIEVSDSRTALAELAAAFSGDPSHELALVGVTGTNGKTTTTYLLAAIFEAAGCPCGQIGTVRYETGGRSEAAVRTTPEAPEIQALLREMRDHDRRACVMEVSSHALALRRVDQIRFKSAVFSNLTRDHLDYHGDMSRYFGAKRRLFEMLPRGAPAVVNVDDPYGRQLAETAERPVTYAIDHAADVRPTRMDLGLEGTALELHTPRGPLQLTTSLLGRLNVYNVLAAVSTALALDLPLDAISRGVGSVTDVPGRLERVSGPADNIQVLVDFAHTDDALRAVLTTARALGSGRVISVFGCGGDRDPAKRPLMGAVAGRLSDLVVVTSDNPRTEDPAAIIADVERGLVSSSADEEVSHLAIVDRRRAIERAVALAEPGDMVVVAGKGHETEQVIGDERRPFDDRKIVAAALARRRRGAASA